MYLRVGDKIICDNGETYTLVKGYGSYTFGILDKNDKIVNYVSDGYLEDCLPLDENSDGYDSQKVLRIGTDKNGFENYVYIIDVIEN